MITIMDEDGVNEIALVRVDHFSTSQEAAQHLWESVNVAAQHNGGYAVLLSPESLGAPHHAVRWEGGPPQWAQAYVVSDGADAREFVAFALDEITVAFSELDS